MKARSFWSLVASSRGFGGSILSGGMRIAWPFCSRSLGCARLPFTRTSPLRMMRWMWLNDRPGIARLEEAVEPHAVLVGADGDGLHALAGLRRGWRLDFGFGHTVSVPAVAGGLRLGRLVQRTDTPQLGEKKHPNRRDHDGAARPPIATAGTAPNSAPITPARKSPSWLEVPVNRPLTALTRPRICGGVRSCTSEKRITTLTTSAAPITASAAIDSHSTVENAKAR